MGCFPSKEKVKILTDIPQFKSRRLGYGVEDKKHFIEDFFGGSEIPLNKMSINQNDVYQSSRRQEIVGK